MGLLEVTPHVFCRFVRQYMKLRSGDARWSSSNVAIDAIGSVTKSGVAVVGSQWGFVRNVRRVYEAVPKPPASKSKHQVTRIRGLSDLGLADRKAEQPSMDARSAAVIGGHFVDVDVTNVVHSQLFCRVIDNPSPSTIIGGAKG